MSPRQGGPTTAVQELAVALLQRGHDVTLTSHDDGESSSPRTSLDPHVQYLRFPIRKGAHWQVSIHYWRWLRSNVRHFDLVHIHGLFLGPGYLAARYARAARIPFIIRPAGSLNRADMDRSSTKTKSAYLRLLENRNLRSAIAIHCTSPSECADAESRGFSNVALIPHGVPRSLFEIRRQPIPGRLLYVGRVAPKKGLHLVLEALALLPAAVELRVAGDASSAYGLQCRELASRLSLEDRIIWLGHINNDTRARELATASFFVLLSEDENFGIAVIEALAAGVPAIVAAGVSTADLIAQEKAGVIVARSGQALAQTLMELLAAPESDLQAMSQSARRTAARFTWEAAVLGLEGLTP